MFLLREREVGEGQREGKRERETERETERDRERERIPSKLHAWGRAQHGFHLMNREIMT